MKCQGVDMHESEALSVDMRFPETLMPPINARGGVSR